MMILVVSKDPGDLKSLPESYGSTYKAAHVTSVSSALDLVRAKACEFLFIDVGLLKKEAKAVDEILHSFWRIYPTLHIIIITPREMIREAVYAVKAGAADYVTYPLNSDEINLILDNIAATFRKEVELDHLRGQELPSDILNLVHTQSEIMKRAFEKVRSVAPTRSTVLLTGETGAGKGVLARLTHRQSNRKDEQFISVHCGAIPDTLIESELFGHEKGAFTGAMRRKLGKFEIARGGTIFLDEIGTITQQTQIKLLQVLQDGTFTRVGGEATIEADTRIIAATNADLKNMVDGGQFRKDLYYRLNVFPIEVPPLRDRIKDIPGFIDIFLRRLNGTYLKNLRGVRPEVLSALEKYTWPGNIRELENLIERAYILETSAWLTTESFPNELFEAEGGVVALSTNSTVTLAEVRQKGIETVERAYLKDVLTKHKGRINAGAATAGITTRQFSKLLKKYNIRKEEFKV